MKYKNYAFAVVLAVIVLCGLHFRLAAQDEPAAAGEKKVDSGARAESVPSLASDPAAEPESAPELEPFLEDSANTQPDAEPVAEPDAIIDSNSVDPNVLSPDKG